MKKLQFFIFCITVFCYSQNTRFVYQVKMKPDSTQRDQIRTELTNLDTDSKGSVFYAAKLIVQDSIMKAYKEGKASFITPEQAKMMRSGIHYSIKKDYKKQEIFYSQSLGPDAFIYSEVKPFNWKITKETKKIGSYNAQKATLQYGGRIWEAWFTTEIPFQDGPYKFCGLPGLIIKVEDSKGDYQFELLEAKKIPAQHQISAPWKQPVKVKKEDFNKVLKRYTEDPVSFLPPPPVNALGNKLDPDPVASKKFKDQVVAERKADNNPIEFN
ncbi:GLPGLI family protein [Elizabethkingia meningoseptica]|uniref:GLPGLI family protein n=1 Tax=Elizabethkingia meningoseptica TaxID=238 RepID=UPI0023AEE971|nr:GLPGLI family protein [Elizabethkingia meningoseptica]MDE5482737.1 GLPGLI family protein [Elizabethkingia meningoseptica]